jgi:copper chaperone NosL
VRTRSDILALIALVLLGTGCGPSRDLDQPPEIRYGQDACDRCQMIIDDARYAAAYWTQDGQARRFDDIGGMFLYEMESGETVAAYWVHDLSDGQWLNGDEAVYVFNAGLATPMGFDLVAFADTTAAEALAFGTPGAQVLNFAEIKAGLASGDLVLDPMRRHETPSDMSGHDTDQGLD